MRKKLVLAPIMMAAVLLSLQVLGEILVLAGFFAFSEKKLDKLTIYSYNEANFR